MQAYLTRILVTVNHQYTGREKVLQDNDTVAVFPPVSGGMDETHLALSETAIDVSELIARVTEPGAGAVVTFLGVVRDNNLGRSVDFLEYEAYTEMALEKMQQVVDEIRRQWPKVRRVALVHRVGHLALGEVATVIAAGAPHRNDGAFEATRYAIDRIKEIVPIWKKEGWSDGAEWLEGDYQPSPRRVKSSGRLAPAADAHVRDAKDTGSQLEPGFLQLGHKARPDAGRLQSAHPFPFKGRRFVQENVPA